LEHFRLWVNDWHLSLYLFFGMWTV
jgi:hypothetical protein